MFIYQLTITFYTHRGIFVNLLTSITLKEWCYMKKLTTYTVLASIVIFGLFLPFIFDLVYYLHPIVLPVVYILLFAFIFLVGLLITGQKLYLPLKVVDLLISMYTFALLVLLFLRPNNQSYDSYNLIPFSTVVFYLSGQVNGLVAFYNLAANVGLFVPFGIYLKIYRYSISQIILLSFLSISFIEMMQMFLNRGSLDIDDLILNIIGVIIGSFIYPVFNKACEITK